MPKRKPLTQAQRLNRATRRRDALIGQGVAFNPKGMSQSGRDFAANNARRAGHGGAAASISAGASGTARAPKAGAGVKGGFWRAIKKK